MSDELDELEKSWDESKYDPNISLREMWDREEKYYAKKEEEEAKKREKERKEEEERRREEEKKEQERIEKILKEMQKNAGSYSTTSARSYPSTSSSVPVSQNHSASDSATQPCYGPMTIGDYIGSCIGLIIVGAGAILPILFLIYIRTIIRAVVWLYHHFFCIITAVFAFILIGYAALTIIDYAYAAMYSVKKTVRKTFIPLYCLGAVVYGILCWNLIRQEQNIFQVIFRKLPVAFYMPVTITLTVLLTTVVADKKLLKFETWKTFFRFPLKVFLVWSVIFLAVYFLKEKSFAVDEVKNALQFYEGIWSAIWQWFIAPLIKK